MPTPAPLLDAMRALRLRYFTPAEIAALHGFPPSFRFRIANHGQTHCLFAATLIMVWWHCTLPGFGCLNLLLLRVSARHAWTLRHALHGVLTSGRRRVLSVLPPGRRFPPHLTLKQRYGLLGNSLSVDMVAALLRYLLGQESAPGVEADSSAAEPAALARMDGTMAH